MILAKNMVSSYFKDMLSLSKSTYIISLVCFVALLTTPVYAEDCQSGDADKDTRCLRQQVTQLTNAIRALGKKTKEFKAKCDQLDVQNKKTIEQSNISIAKKKEIIKAQSEIIKAQEKDRELANKQVSKLKLCCLGNPNNLPLRFSIGIGATNNNSSAEAAGLIGVGIGSINIHGFLQSGNSG